MNMLTSDIRNFETRTIFKLRHIKQLLEVCLYKSYFLWNNQIHSLEDSGPIGLSLMVVLAESFLQTIEKRAINIAINKPIPVNPITHKRYVDDTHDRFKNKQLSEEFLKILNNQEPRIQFEAEYEDENKTLNFLDIKIINTTNGYYEFKIHRKDAITNIQIKPDSSHDEKVKDGVFKGYISRAKAICSPKYINDVINFIKQVFIDNGYDKDKLEKLINDMKSTKTKKKVKQPKYVSLPWIPGLSQKLKKSFKKVGCEVTFKSPKNLNLLLTKKNKPELPPNIQPGVYFISTSRKGGYTGETKKCVKTRNIEHEKAVFKGDIKNDAVAEHEQACNCNIEWAKTKTLAVEPSYFRRKVREALEIRKLRTGPDDPNGLNRDYGDYVTTNTWQTLFDKIDNEKEAHNKT